MFHPGTFGQPKHWDIYDISSYQHPMAPYDVLMDPDTFPKHPILQNTCEKKEETNEPQVGFQV